MPIDKFGNTDKDDSPQPTVTSSIELTLSQLVNVFLRRDGGNNSTGDLDLNNHRITNIAEPENSGDATSKKYVDAQTVSKTGDIMTGNLLFRLGNKNSLSLGCSDLKANKRFSLLLGNTLNLLYCQTGQPITVQSSDGISFRDGDSEVA